MMKLKEWMVFLLLEFIGENWVAFQSWCENRGESEGTADEIYKALGGEE